MSETGDKPKLSEDFAKVLEEWRKRHDLREDEPLLLCLELFRIHQEHWDDIRRKDLPSFSEFRESLVKLQQQGTALQRQVTSLLEELRRHPAHGRWASPTVAGMVLTAVLSIATGILIGRFLL